MDTKNGIEKLNNKNYFNWKLKMKLVLIKEDLWDVIESERPTSDKHALAFIGLAVEDSQLIHLRDKNTAYDCWKALQEAHEKDTITNKISLYKKIALNRMKDNTTMEDHLNEILNLFQKLSDLGADADEEWKIGMIFTSLPTSYSTLITALEARDQKDLTVSLVQSKLLDEYSRQQEQQNYDSDEKIMQVGRVSEKLICEFCLKDNHKMKNCYKLKEFREFQKYKEFVKKENEKHQSNSIVEESETEDKKPEFLLCLTNNKKDTTIDSTELILKEIINFKISNQVNFETQINQLEILFDKLNDTEEKLSDNWKSDFAINMLQLNYSGFLSTLESNSSRNVSWNVTKRKIIAAVRKIQNQEVYIKRKIKFKKNQNVLI